MERSSLWFGVDQKYLKRLKDHKYSGHDDSLLARYILQPYWNFIIEFVPLWVAPNLLTLLGLVSVVATFSLTFTISSTRFVPLPSWMYLIIAFGRFVYQSLDAIDGKQARRTKSSSPLGELFDHGCDALNSAFLVLSIAYSLMWNLGMTLGMLIFTFLCFYIATLDTYYTGTLYLGYINGPVEGEILIIMILVLSGIYGTHIWAYESPLLDQNWGNIFVGIFVLGGIITCINSLVRVNKKLNSRWKGIYRNSTLSMVLDLLKILPISLGSVFWMLFGGEFIKTQQLLFLFTFIIGFSHILCKLVLSHILHINIEFLLLPQLCCALGGICALMRSKGLIHVDDHYEEIFLIFSFMFNLIHYICFASGIMRQFSSYLGVRCFSLRPRV